MLGSHQKVILGDLQRRNMLQCQDRLDFDSDIVFQIIVLSANKSPHCMQIFSGH